MKSMCKEDFGVLWCLWSCLCYQRCIHHMLQYGIIQVLLACPASVYMPCGLGSSTGPRKCVFAHVILKGRHFAGQSWTQLISSRLFQELYGTLWNSKLKFPTVLISTSASLQLLIASSACAMRAFCLAAIPVVAGVALCRASVWFELLRLLPQIDEYLK